MGGASTQPSTIVINTENNLTKLNKDLKSRTEFINQLYLLMKCLRFYFYFVLFNTSDLMYCTEIMYINIVI